MLVLKVIEGREQQVSEDVLQRLDLVTAIRQSIAEGTLVVGPPRFSQESRPKTGSAKRRVVDERGKKTDAETNGDTV